MFDDLRAELGMPDARTILQTRPAQLKAERSLADRGAILRGTKPVVGNYLCTVCGFCCFHHDRPLCELGQWIHKNDDEVWTALGGHACRLCMNRDRGMLLRMSAPRYTFMQGRENGRNAMNHGGGRPLGAYLARVAALSIEVHDSSSVSEVIPYEDGEMLIDTADALLTGMYRNATDAEKFEAFKNLPRFR